RTHVLSGVYVPALHHLLSYKEPPERNDRNPDPAAKRRRDITAWYLLEVGDYLGATAVGYPDGYWWRFMMQISELFKKPPRYLSRPMFGGEDILVDWKVVFQENDKNLALILRDMVALDSHWLAGVNEGLDKF